MNPHYHPYPDLGSSPHSPSPDNANYPGGMVGGGGPHHNGHGPGVGGPQGGGGGGNPMGVSQMDSQAVGGFHGMNNGAGPVKHCAGCGGECCLLVWLGLGSVGIVRKVELYMDPISVVRK